MSDAVNRALGRAVEFEHPTDGRRRELGRLIRVSGATLLEYRCAPELGEHTREILTEVGCSADLIDRLEMRGCAKVG